MIQRLTVLGLLLGGCSINPGQSIRADAEMVRRESTWEVLQARGDTFGAVGDTTRAEQYYAAALTAGGNAATLVRRLIRVCVRDQRYRAAFVYADDYLRRHPTDHAVRFAHATIASAIGDTELAHTELTQLTRATPNDPEVHFALAVLLRDDFADLPQARRHFSRYLALAPQGVNASQARAAAEEGPP